MPKKIEDIVMPERRKSIRDIPLPENRRSRFPSMRPANPITTDGITRPTMHAPPSSSAPRPGVGLPVDNTDTSLPPINQTERYHDFATRSRRPKGKGKKIFIVIVALLLVLGFGFLTLIGGATLSYTPKSELLTFEGDVYSAFKADETSLVYSVVKLSGEKGVPVPASGEEKVERKASGTIVVFNNAGTEPQRLVENTRFQTSDGKVYRIRESISVPGQKTVSGVLQPGSLEVVAYADEAGEGYNIGLSDFSLPGLAGTSRATTVYARSKTPMTGGLVGVEKKVDEATLQTARASLEVALHEELATQARAQVPADFIMFPSLASVTFEDLPQTDVTNSDVTVNIMGNFYGVMFKRSDLAEHLAFKKIGLIGEPVEIASLDSLNVSFAGEPPADLLSSTKLDFTVSGQATIVWRIDEDILKKDLVGRNKKDTPIILNNYPNIVGAEATVRPFWKSSFPSNASDISIKRISVQ
jgi:hypothetical protein